MKKNKHNPVAANILPATTLTETAPREVEPRDMWEFLGVAAQVAQDTFYSRNSRWIGGMDEFPFEPMMRICDRLFRFAEGGALYVDEPKTLAEKKDCIRKAAAMRKHGHRYVYIFRENGLDPEPEDVLRQLDGVA